MNSDPSGSMQPPSASIPQEALNGTSESGILWEAYPPDEREWLQTKLAEAGAESIRPQASGFSRPLAVIVPGLLGSTLGRRLDTVWLDLTEIPRGGLRQLALPAGNNLSATGVRGLLRESYRPAAAALAAAGFEVSTYAWDWRQELGAQGEAFARWLNANASGRDLSIVAHSGGGLITRLALPHLDNSIRIRKIISAGVPHQGSVSPVLLMRDLFDTAATIARWDCFHDRSAITSIFATFPGLLGLLARFGPLDLFDSRAWPPGPHPQAILRDVLPVASTALSNLPDPPASTEYHTIAGSGLPTVTEYRSDASGFVFTMSRAGDGTVPEFSAAASGSASSHFVHSAIVSGGFPGSRDQADHGNLLRRPVVAEAVVAILRGEAPALPTTPADPGTKTEVTEGELMQRMMRIRSASATRTMITDADRLAFGLDLMRMTADLPPETQEEIRGPLLS